MSVQSLYLRTMTLGLTALRFTPLEVVAIIEMANYLLAIVPRLLKSWNFLRLNDGGVAGSLVVTQDKTAVEENGSSAPCPDCPATSL